MAVEQEWAKRVRAAAAYAGIGYADLAEQLGMSDSTLRRHLSAEKRPHEQRALWQTVADLTELPYEFFTIDFARLPEMVLDHPTPADPDHLVVAQVREVLRGPDFRAALLDALEDLGPDVLRRALDHAEGGAVDPLEQDSRAAGRIVTAAAADLLDTYEEADAAADDTPDTADANPEVPPARSAGKRSGA